MSTIGIMQPYFFPYLGYFQLIQATDQWIVFDTPQYIRHGWINRNRVLKPDGTDWQYINIPLKKHSREATILEIEASDTENWRERILGQLNHYKKKAPHYVNTIDVVKKSMGISSNNIVDLNVASLSAVCEYLDIDFKYTIYSKMSLDHEAPSHAGEWALYISKAVGAKKYINPPGGKELFDPQQFKNADLDLSFLETTLTAYDQRNSDFIPGLSIIDVMMFNGPDDIKKMLSNYTLV